MHVWIRWRCGSEIAIRVFFLIPVFVEGDYDLDDVFCASWTVVIVTAASFVFLQFCILVVCVLCIYASRRSPVKEEESSSSSSASSSSSSSDRSSSIMPPPSSLYQRHLAGLSEQHPHLSSSLGRASGGTYNRSSPSHHPMQPPASTLKSLRTSLRD